MIRLALALDQDPAAQEPVAVSVDDATQKAAEYAEFAKAYALEHGPSILLALAILLIGWFFAKTLKGILKRLLLKAKFDPTLTGFLCNMAYMGLMALVVLSAIEKLGVQTASFIAILGAAGFAVGFALQGSLANFASGVMLMVFRPFKAGDFVEAGGTSGSVVEVGIFATIFKTGDNKKVIVSNSSVTGGNITNYSANPTRRVDMVFGIGYGDDLKKAKQLLEQIVTADERVLKDPAPTIAISELADSSVNIVCRPWVNTPDYWAVYFDTHEKVKLTFDAEGVSIPFPQRDVHMHSVAG